MPADAVAQGRQGELWRRLAAVDDPELDESIVAMGFVEQAEVAEDGAVAVAFRLPTYWCSPNFAYLMLDGIRRELDALSWRPRYRVTLLDHMLDAEINAGVAAGRSFGAIVDALAPDGDIVTLRATFARKAFQRRQEAVLLALRAQGLGDAAILALSDAELGRHAEETPSLAQPVQRYRAAWAARFHGTAAAFPKWDGTAIALHELPAHLAELRRVRINMEFNGALCRGLKQTRYQEMRMAAEGPTLVDFIRSGGAAAADQTIKQP